MKNKIIIILSIMIIISITLLINLHFINKVDFNLVGSSKIVLNVGDNWIDPLYTISNNQNKVKIINKADLNKEGTYTIKYIVTVGLFSKTLTREIQVLPSNKLADITLIMKGNNPYYLTKGQVFNDPGIKGFDKYSGNIDNKITIVSNNINNQINGNYEVIYEAKGSNGIIKRIKRDIVVYSFDFNSQLKYADYSQNNEIILNINDTQYSYAILPNKNKIYERNISYPIEENGTYIFDFYDQNNQNIFSYETTINTIDKTPPSGTCILSLNDNDGIIKVDAKDNAEIGGYEYFYGNNKTNILNNSNYTINSLDTAAKVTVYDKAQNKTTIECTTVDNSTKITSGYNLNSYQYNGRTYQYWLYMPKNNTKRQEMPLVIYLHGDGGRKSTNDVNKYALPKYIANGDDYPFFMIAPYCNNQANFHNEGYMNFIIELINYITKTYNIDTSRIIMSGGSSGAAGAYLITAKNKIFSSLVIISGVTYTLDADKEKDLTYLPIWVFHGNNDRQVDYNTTKRHVDNIKTYGGNIKLTTYNGGHDSTDIAFATKEVINWMISQRKT